MPRRFELSVRRFRLGIGDPASEGIGDPASGVDRSAKPAGVRVEEAGGSSIVPMNIDRIGIVGTGLAGLRAAAELREAGFAGSIVAWDAEGTPPYDRPPLSKNLFDNPVRPLADQGLGDLASLGAEVVPHPVERLRRGDGAWLADETPVDAAIIASGSSPRIGAPGAFALHTAADALRLADSLAPGVRLDIVGAGWVGTELASVASAVCEVHLWESSLHILGRTFGGAVDDLWSDWLDDAGVSLHLGQRWPIEGESAEGSQSGPAEGPASSAGQRPRPLNRPSTPERRVLVQAVGAAPSFPAIEPAVDVGVRGALVTDMWTRVLRNGQPVEGLYAVGDCADALTPHGPRKGGHWTKALADGAFTAAAVRRKAAQVFGAAGGLLRPIRQTDRLRRRNPGPCRRHSRAGRRRPRVRRRSVRGTLSRPRRPFPGCIRRRRHPRRRAHRHGRRARHPLGEGGRTRSVAGDRLAAGTFSRPKNAQSQAVILVSDWGIL